MPEKWTGALIGRMHCERITYEDLAKKLGLTKSYISMVLNGTRKTKGIQERFENAVEEIIAERAERV